MKHVKLLGDLSAVRGADRGQRGFRKQKGVWGGHRRGLPGLGKFGAKSYLLSGSTAWPLIGDGQEGGLLDV